MADFVGAKDKTTWKEITLEHIRKILECSRTEFRGGFYTKIGDNPTREAYIPDTRETYINGVKALSDVLLPFFDTDMTNVSKEIEESFENIRSYIEQLRKKKLKKQFILEMKEHKKNPSLFDKPDKKLLKEELDQVSIIDVSDVPKYKLILARKLFQQLNLLLRRIDYLKGSIYQEGEEE